jgi:hypothetical protein
MCTNDEQQMHAAMVTGFLNPTLYNLHLLSLPAVTSTAVKKFSLQSNSSINAPCIPLQGQAIRRSALTSDFADCGSNASLFEVVLQQGF